MNGDDLEFREEDHTYWSGGVQVPNVTSVLEAFALQYAGINPVTLQKAQERGTAVHLATEYDDQGLLDVQSLDERLVGYLAAWRKFRRDAGFTPTAIEQKVFSRRDWYAGTLDRCGMCAKLRTIPSDEEILLDIKTGSAMGPTTGPQTAAYANALRKDRRRKPLRRCGVELHKDGNYDFKELKDPDDLAVFLAALKLLNWRKRHARD